MQYTMKMFTASLLALLLLLTAGTTWAAASAAGSITLLTGRATAAAADGSIRPLRQGDSIYSGEMLSTGPGSYLNVKFSDGGRILLRPNSRFEIEQYTLPTAAAAPRPGQPAPAAGAQAQQGNAFFRLLKGGFRAVTGLIGRENKDAYQVRTPVATIGIRGTNFEARICAGDCVDIDPMPQDGLYAGVFEGGIAIVNEAGEQVSLAGQYAYVAGPDSLPVPLGLRPRVLAQDPMPDPETCGE